jgi:hypothetical protein
VPRPCRLGRRRAHGRARDGQTLRPGSQGRALPAPVPPSRDCRPCPF